MKFLCALPVLVSLLACGEAPPPKKTVFDDMVRQEKAVPAAIQKAQAEHMDEVRKQDEETGPPR